MTKIDVIPSRTSSISAVTNTVGHWCPRLSSGNQRVRGGAPRVHMGTLVEPMCARMRAHVTHDRLETTRFLFT